MNNFSSEEILELLKLRAESSAFKAWDKPLKSYDYFISCIWLKALWSSWYYTGVIDGAIMLNSLNYIDKDNLAEYQCLLHHFCINSEVVNAHIS